MEIPIIVGTLAAVGYFLNQDGKASRSTYKNKDPKWQQKYPFGNQNLVQQVRHEEQKVLNKRNEKSLQQNSNILERPQSNVDQMNRMQYDNIYKNPYDVPFHNNMQPFYGTNKTQAMPGEFGRNDDVSQRTLELFTGAGTNSKNPGINFNRTEVGALFKPQENISYPHGSPNTNDTKQTYYQSGGKMNNVAPVEQIRVGPGICIDPLEPAAGGFQQYARIKPTNVSSYKLTQLPGRMVSGKAVGLQPGSQACVDKNLPNRVWGYEQHPSMPSGTSLSKPAQRENYCGGRCVDRNTAIGYEGIGSSGGGANKPMNRDDYSEVYLRNPVSYSYVGGMASHNGPGAYPFAEKAIANRNTNRSINNPEFLEPQDVGTECNSTLLNPKGSEKTTERSGFYAPQTIRDVQQVDQTASGPGPAGGAPKPTNYEDAYNATQACDKPLAVDWTPGAGNMNVRGDPTSMLGKTQERITLKSDCNTWGGVGNQQQHQNYLQDNNLLVNPNKPLSVVNNIGKRQIDGQILSAIRSNPLSLYKF